MIIAYCSSIYKVLICKSKFKNVLSLHAKCNVQNFIVEKYGTVFQAFCPTKHNFPFFTGSHYSFKIEFWK
jgi:hypothetical protein